MEPSQRSEQVLSSLVESYQTLVYAFQASALFAEHPRFLQSAERSGLFVCIYVYLCVGACVFVCKIVCVAVNVRRLLLVMGSVLLPITSLHTASGLLVPSRIHGCTVWYHRSEVQSGLGNCRSFQLSRPGNCHPF
jgi:hypothetical protein